jgi:hypothetical protein
MVDSVVMPRHDSRISPFLNVAVSQIKPTSVPGSDRYQSDVPIQGNGNKFSGVRDE